MSPTWQRVYEGHGLGQVLESGPWKYFDASNVNFKVGEPIAGELTLRGESPSAPNPMQNWFKPTLCVFTLYEFNHLDTRSRPIQGQEPKRHP